VDLRSGWPNLMHIQVYRSNAELPDHLRGQILSLIRIEWPDDAGDYLGPEALPETWHPSHVVGTQGDAILSYAGVVWRHIEHAGEIFKTYGLSSVFTFPAMRRRGLGSRIVRHATSWIRQTGDGDIAVLFTAPGMEPFYERCGWQAMPATRFLIGDRAAPRVHAAVTMMLFLSAKGREHQSAFTDAPVYVGVDAW
jgi:GNAT superfamily N-acetyltransferase